MQQGDQCFLPMKVKDAEGNLITSDDCYDFKVKIGWLSEKSYRAGTLFAQTENGTPTGLWLYPLTQADSLELGPVSGVQAQVKFADGTIVGTSVVSVNVGTSIISTDHWPEADDGDDDGDDGEA